MPAPATGEEGAEGAHGGGGLGAACAWAGEVGPHEGGGDAQGAESRVDDDARDGAEVSVESSGGVGGVEAGARGVEAGPDDLAPPSEEGGEGDDEDAGGRAAPLDEGPQDGVDGRGRAREVVPLAEGLVVGPRSGLDPDESGRGRCCLIHP